MLRQPLLLFAVQVGAGRYGVDPKKPRALVQVAVHNQTSCHRLESVFFGEVAKRTQAQLRCLNTMSLLVLLDVSIYVFLLDLVTNVVELDHLVVFLVHQAKGSKIRPFFRCLETALTYLAQSIVDMLSLCHILALYRLWALSRFTGFPFMPMGCVRPAASWLCAIIN